MNWLQRLFEKKPSFEDAFRHCNTPEEICDVVTRWVKPEIMENNHRPTPIDTWNLGVGDCDDIAYLIYEICRNKNILCTVWFFWPMDKCNMGHAMVLGTNWFADLGRYIVSDDVYHDASIGACKDLGCAKVWSKLVT